jgi:hypothetical protein
MFDTIHHFQMLPGAFAVEVQGSCVGSNSCGFGVLPAADGGLLFGATSITSTNVAEGWIDDSNSTTVYSMSRSDQGMFNSYAAISATWADTTAMDNLRAADITATTVAGSLETIADNTAATNVRGGHSVPLRSLRGSPTRGARVSLAGHE